MILINDVLSLHQYSIDKYGGANGIRDEGGLKSAIARPFQTFDGSDLNATIFEKVAALGESLIINHSFIDGNLRTGFLAMATLLIDNGLMLIATQEDAYDFIIKVSTGELRFDGMVIWLKENTDFI